MSRDRSLDEFAGGSDSGGESDDTARDDADDGSRDVGAIEATYAWSPDGADCDACGANVASRWRDDRDLVCADCKEW